MPNGPVHSIGFRDGERIAHSEVSGKGDTMAGNKALGARLRVARKACEMTQGDVADYLDVSRSTVAQMELGNRSVSSLELEKLAYYFGRDIGDFFEKEFAEEDSLVAMFRAHPEVTSQPDVPDVLRRCLRIGRELNNLEHLLEIDKDLGSAASYNIPMLRNKRDAVVHGIRIANEERRRLGLGNNPIPNVADLLETQGILTAQVDMPEDISGFTLSDSEVGFFIVVNRVHNIWRRRFSYAHEYAHVLMDREKLGTISRFSERDSLKEVRANSFAAAFLMSENGVHQYLASLGKSKNDQRFAEIFDEKDVVKVIFSSDSFNQSVKMYDVVQIANHFKVSCLAAIYRMKNLRLISNDEMNELLKLEEEGIAGEIERLLDLVEPDHEMERDEFKHRVIGLGLEALRRSEISLSKFMEIVELVDVHTEYLSSLLREMGFEFDDDETDAFFIEDEDES